MVLLLMKTIPVISTLAMAPCRPILNRSLQKTIAVLQMGKLPEFRPHTKKEAESITIGVIREEKMIGQSINHHHHRPLAAAKSNNAPNQSLDT